MRRRLVFVLACALSLLLGLLSSVGLAAAEERYTVAFVGESLPAGYDALIRAAGGRVVSALPQIGVVTAESADPSFLSEVRSRPETFAAGPVTTVRLPLHEMEPLDLGTVGLAPPGDYYNRYQWDVKRVTRDGQSFRIQPGNRSVIVGVIDSGIQLDHHDLKANIVPGSRSFVPGVSSADDALGHGTFVAGQVAANGRVYGVGPHLGLRAYRVFGASNVADSTWIQQAIVAAADDGVDVVNLSVGGFRSLQDPAQVADAVAYLRAIRYALRKGVTVVAAAGNDGLDLRNPRHAAQALGVDRGVVVEVPGGLPGLITVSSSNRADELAFYSNYGQGVIELGAPGGDCGPGYTPGRGQSCDPTGQYRIVSTFRGNGYARSLGTSFAAPKVAGIAALVVAQEGRIGPARVAHRLFQTAIDVGPPGKDAQFGYGLPDAVAAVQGR